MEYKIESDRMSVKVSSLGGCLASVFDKRDSEELLYQKEPDSWQGQDIAIFPFIARLKGKTYTHNGKEYSLRNHGLCRYYEFKVLEQEKDSISLVFESNEETMKEYPFPFRFTASYSIKDNRVRVAYAIENTGGETMPFGLGAHPAFIVDSVKNENGLDTSNNAVKLDKPTKLTRICFDDKGEFVLGEEDYGVRDSLPTDKQTFRDYKTLCVKGEGLNHVKLVRGNGRTLEFQYDEINYLVVWSFPETGSYVALEPWMSVPDYDDCDKEILKKKTLLHLGKGEIYNFSYTISI